jgi:hypothetical protein
MAAGQDRKQARLSLPMLLLASALIMFGRQAGKQATTASIV